MSNQEHHFANVVTGTLLGAFVGAGVGLGTCMYLFDRPLLFPGDTIIFGALICGILGFLFGEGFITWLKENWYWFW